MFVISWVNPDERLADKDFDDYLLEGPLAALDAIEKATGEKDVNAIGYCLGGTLLGGDAGYLAAKKNTRIASATFMTSLIDFTGAGELEVFIDEEQVESLERKMSERGYLEGSEMANTFNMLRGNDLIWSFVINNYLLGRDPFPFDLLHWNCDSTRMPAKMHSFYLRNMYMNNLLREPAGITLAGTPIDLPRSPCRRTSLSAIEDHIAPWKTTYAGPQLARRQVALRAVRLRPHRRHDQSAGGQQIRLLDQREAACQCRRVAQGRQAARRLVVGRLACLARPETGWQSHGSRAREGSRQDETEHDRTGAGQLCKAAHRHGVTQVGAHHVPAVNLIVVPIVVIPARSAFAIVDDANLF